MSEQVESRASPKASDAAAQSPVQAEHEAALLDVVGLKTHFFTFGGVVKAVDGVSLSVRRGETLGVVGESGCGKSVTALSIIGLVPDPPGRTVAGRIDFEGRGDLVGAGAEAMREIRGNEISMIFQEPMTSLNPVFRVGMQIAEAIRLHRKVSKKEAMDSAIEMLGLVGIPSPMARARDYPHQLSGGMRQRVMIAMAMACQPKLLLADEPTTALDVTVQAQILDLMNRMKEASGAAIMLITHDMGVIAEMCQRVSVMYAGVVVEHTDVQTLFANPLHPYTVGLLDSIPRGRGRGGVSGQLKTIPGIVPNLLHLPKGCRFQDRCSQVHAACRQSEPPLARSFDEDGAGHLVRCWLHVSPAETPARPQDQS